MDARSIFLPFLIPLMIRRKTVVVLLNLSIYFSSSSAAGTKECLDFISRCCVVRVNRSRSKLELGLDAFALPQSTELLNINY